MASRRRATARLWAALAVAASIVLSGCGSPRQQVAASVGEAISVLRTAALALTLDADGSSTHAVTTTVVDEAVTAITATEGTLGTVPTRGNDDETAQDRALVLVGRARDALLTARRELDRPDTARTAAERLRAVADDLDDYAADLPDPR